FYEFDFIIAMDKDNLSNIKRLMPEDATPKILLMRHFDTTGKDQEVPDPYYGELKDFEKVYAILDRSCDVMLGFLMDELKQAR
ncbi:MAG: low molecular weight phosphotyrosine protein phosphatase, partial [Bacteroidia bacterium]|nr:low molecular weight phosphotyrosine protein phosphatase [Bacteroidia bacterium]